MTGRTSAARWARPDPVDDPRRTDVAARSQNFKGAVAIPDAAPALGHHAEILLNELLGYDRDDFTGLRERGVI